MDKIDIMLTTILEKLDAKIERQDFSPSQISLTPSETQENSNA